MFVVFLSLCGCASNSTPPLFFGEQITIGMEIGVGPSSGGVDFALGYRDIDVAIVPVYAVSNGKTHEIAAWNREGGANGRDALSVFGQFKGGGGKPVGTDGANAKATPRIALGRFFATGLAATSLASGYLDGWTEQSSPKVVLDAENTKESKPTVIVHQVCIAQEARPNCPPAQVVQAQGADQAYAPPLVFAQTNTLGIGIVSSIADQGPQFTLGYTGRDIAFIPVVARKPNGDMVRLGGRNQVGTDGNIVKDPNDSVEADALSVFGQFKVDTETASVQFGLSRFFTTGMAARNLAEAFKAAIARELKADLPATGSGAKQ